MSPTVYDEVVEGGRRVHAPEVAKIDNAVRDRWLRRDDLSSQEEELAEQLRTTTHLHKGECEALAMARSREAWLLVDDKEARTVAEGFGLHYIGTAGVLLKALAAAIMTLSEFEEAITALTRISWLSPEVIALILKKAREEQA